MTNFSYKTKKLFLAKEKRPLTAHWKEDATLDHSSLKNAAERAGGDVQLAMPTGSESGVTVVDIDNKTGEADKLLKTWPETFTVKTPSGGYHLYYAYDPRARTGVRSYDDSTDCRNDGGYVIVAGEGYSILKDTPIISLPRLPNRTKEVKEVKSDVAVLEGGRNHYLTSLAGKLQRHGVTGETLLAALRAENDSRLSPPLDDSEVVTIAQSVARYAPSDEIVVPEFKVLTFQGTVRSTLEYLKDPSKLSGVPTGYNKLDVALGGGLQDNQLTVINAEAKTGKSTFIQQMMYDLNNRGNKVAYISCEMNPITEVNPHFISLYLKKNVRKRGLTDKDIEELQNLKMDNLIYMDHYGALELEALTYFVREAAAGGYKFFFIDHFHFTLLNPEDYNEVARTIRDIKKLTRDFNIHIILIVQPPKISEGQILGLNSLKGGSSVGQALDNLITLQRVSNIGDENVDNVSQVNVTHVRSPAAKPGKFYIEYDPNTMIISELVPSQEPTLEAATKRQLVSLDDLKNL